MACHTSTTTSFLFFSAALQHARANGAEGGRCDGKHLHKGITEQAGVIEARKTGSTCCSNSENIGLSDRGASCSPSFARICTSDLQMRPVLKQDSRQALHQMSAVSIEAPNDSGCHLLGTICAIYIISVWLHYYTTSL